MAYYPVMLDLRGRRVLFVGGGWETEAKVRGLLEAGAEVTLLSPFEHPGLEPLVHSGRISWLRRGYRRGDLAGFRLCFAHPPDRSLNALIAREARERGVWLNAVDDPAHCDFILPAVHRQGDLVIAVSTGGAAPALGVRIKQRLAEEYGPEYERVTFMEYEAPAPDPCAEAFLRLVEAVRAYEAVGGSREDLDLGRERKRVYEALDKGQATGLPSTK